jgi:hypothetical protein
MTRLKMKRALQIKLMMMSICSDRIRARLGTNVKDRGDIKEERDHVDGVEMRLTFMRTNNVEKRY